MLSRDHFDRAHQTHGKQQLWSYFQRNNYNASFDYAKPQLPSRYFGNVLCCRWMFKITIREEGVNSVSLRVREKPHLRSQNRQPRKRRELDRLTTTPSPNGLNYPQQVKSSLQIAVNRNHGCSTSSSESGIGSPSTNTTNCSQTHSKKVLS